MRSAAVLKEAMHSVLASLKSCCGTGFKFFLKEGKD